MKRRQTEQGKIISKIQIDLKRFEDAKIALECAVMHKAHFSVLLEQAREGNQFDTVSQLIKRMEALYCIKEGLKIRGPKI